MVTNDRGFTMNESGFSKWLVGHFRNQGAFVQRLEVTTGSGVPDLVVIHKGKTHWVELKWSTNHIRPEQYVWARNAWKAGTRVNYILGFDKGIQVTGQPTTSDNFETHFKKMTNTFKLIRSDLNTTDFDRVKSSIPDILRNLT